MLDQLVVSMQNWCRCAGDSVKFQQLKLLRETEIHIQVIFKLYRVSSIFNDIKFVRKFCNLQTTIGLSYSNSWVCFRLLILLAT